MSALEDIPLTSLKTLAIVAVLAILSLLAGASLLARSAPSRYPRRTRHWLGHAIILLVPTSLVASAGALVFSRSLDPVRTSGDLVGLALLSVVGTTAQSSDKTDVSAQSVAVSELDTTLTEIGDSILQTTWTGPSNGVTQPVFVITPRDYSPNDGKTYAIIGLPRSYPGGPDGTMQGTQVQETLNNVIDEGIIPPTIVVGPSPSVGEEAHDCTGIGGRPAIYMWVPRNVLAMIRRSFSGTTSHRDAWMIGGFSAGAYCAVQTALRTPETYGAAASLSGYDTQIEGQVTNQGEQYLADNMPSTIPANRTPSGIRIYTMATDGNTVGGACTALKMALAVKEPDSVTTNIPPSDGHADPLWRERIPTMLAW